MFNEGYYRPATASSSISSDSNSHLETREQDLISNQLLIYPAAIAYLKKVSSRGIPGWTPSEVSKLLESHLHSMTAVDPVSGIVRSLECRKTLLQVCSKLGLANDPNLRATLRKDGTRIAALLVSIFTSQSLEEIALRLEGDPAQCFLDVVQSTLDKGLLRVDEHCRMARRMIRKLCASGDMLPSALFITGIIGKEQHPTFGGAYGDIYRASYDDQIVALKYMRAVQFMRGSDLREIRRKFCREALLWKSLHHPHILPFLGIDQDTFPLSLVTVSPWMEHGTIMSYLKKHGHENVDKFLYEIAQGLQYLHSCGIVHGDLRGTNILINEHWSACLADFGLSILSDATATMSTNRGGSLYWMAPELLAPDRFGTEFTRTPASDVFAFGCVCFELYTGRPPFGDLPEPAALIKVVTGKRQERFSSPPAISDFLWQHVTACWDQNPTVRPVTETVVRSMVWPASVTPVLPSSGIPMPTAVPSRVEQAVDAPFSVPSVISSSPNNLEMHLESNSRRTTSSETLSVRSGASSSSSLSTPFHKRFRQPPPPEGHPLIPELHAMPRNLFPRIIRRGPVSVRGNGIFGRWFWSNKWMTLMERFLTVHKSEETPQQYFILLERITKIEQSSLKPYCLALETQDRKRHFFSFRNDQEMHGWKHDLSPPKPEAVARYDEKARLSENEQNEQASLELHPANDFRSVLPLDLIQNDDEWTNEQAENFDQKEPEDITRFIDSSLLSNIAIYFRDKVPRGTHVRGDVPYFRAFTGEDAVTTIQSHIQPDLMERYILAFDRRTALQIAQNLQSQLFFCEIEGSARTLQDTAEDVYMFLDDLEALSPSDPAPNREPLPTAVITTLARCYSPVCGDSGAGLCYSYSCPFKVPSVSGTHSIEQ